MGGPLDEHPQVATILGTKQELDFYHYHFCYIITADSMGNLNQPPWNHLESWDNSSVLERLENGTHQRSEPRG